MMKPFFFINNKDSDYECNFDIFGYNQKRFREACFLGGGGFSQPEKPRGAVNIGFLTVFVHKRFWTIAAGVLVVKEISYPISIFTDLLTDVYY